MLPVALFRFFKNTLFVFFVIDEFAVVVAANASSVLFQASLLLLNANDDWDKILVVVALVDNDVG